MINNSTKITIALSLFLFFGCSEIKQPPKYLLEDEKMIAILIDAHLLESKLEKLEKPLDSLHFLAHKNYNEIYLRHQVSDSQFLKSFNYYQNNPAEMDLLYEKILDSLSRLDAILKGGNALRNKP